jgi:hypothetical protein
MGSRIDRSSCSDLLVSQGVCRHRVREDVWPRLDAKFEFTERRFAAKRAL